MPHVGGLISWGMCLTPLLPVTYETMRTWSRGLPWHLYLPGARQDRTFTMMVAMGGFCQDGRSGPRRSMDICTAMDALLTMLWPVY